MVADLTATVHWQRTQEAQTTDTTAVITRWTIIQGRLGTVIIPVHMWEPVRTVLGSDLGIARGLDPPAVYPVWAPQAMVQDLYHIGYVDIFWSQFVISMLARCVQATWHQLFIKHYATQYNKSFSVKSWCQETQTSTTKTTTTHLQLFPTVFVFLCIKYSL